VIVVRDAGSMLVYTHDGGIACPSVKLLRPSTGAFELFCPVVLTALLPGPDLAAGA